MDAGSDMMDQVTWVSFHFIKIDQCTQFLVGHLNTVNPNIFASLSFVLIFLRRNVPGQTGARTRNLWQHRLALNTNALTLTFVKSITMCDAA
jgi:hypothetical protein